MRVIFLFALFFALLAMVAAGKHGKAVAAEADGEAVVKTHKKKCAKKHTEVAAGEAARRLLGKKHAAAEADGEAVVKTHKKKCSKKHAVAGEA